MTSMPAGGYLIIILESHMNGRSLSIKLKEEMLPRNEQIDNESTD